jgi:hypothetical protein
MKKLLHDARSKVQPFPKCNCGNKTDTERHMYCVVTPDGHVSRPSASFSREQAGIYYMPEGHKRALTHRVRCEIYFA